MVDVGVKPVTSRKAVAEGSVQLGADAFRSLGENNLEKGDALAVARLAGIQAGKRTGEWIPLCHNLSLDFLGVDIRLEPGTKRAVVTAEARARGATGVEMEAMVAASAACLTLYDMTKGIDRGARIGPIRLLEKHGGKSGSWRAEEER